MDASEFYELGRAYLQSNLKQSVSDKIVEPTFKSLWKLIPDDVQRLNINEFYSRCVEFFLNSSSFISHFYRENLKANARVENLSLILFSLQRLVLNLITVRFFYHLEHQQYQHSYLSLLRNLVRCLDQEKTKEVSSEGNVRRRAEVILIDYIFAEEIHEKGFYLAIYPSRKLCLDCHSLLRTLQQIQLNLNFFDASNLDFKKRWVLPSEIQNI